MFIIWKNTLFYFQYPTATFSKLIPSDALWHRVMHYNTMRTRVRHGVLHHRKLNSSVNILFRLTTEEIVQLHCTVPLWRNPPVIDGYRGHRGSNVNHSPQKRAVILDVFLCLWFVHSKLTQVLRRQLPWCLVCNPGPLLLKSRQG